MNSPSYHLGYDSHGTAMVNPYPIGSGDHASFQLGRANAVMETQPPQYRSGRNSVASPGAVLFHVMARHGLSAHYNTPWDGLCQQAQDGWEKAAAELRVSLEVAAALAKV